MIHHKLAKNPIEKANWFSKFSFSWLSPLFSIGRKRMLVEEDLHQLPKSETSNYLHNKLNQNWELELQKQNEQTNYKASLWKALIKTYIRPLIIYTIIQTIEEFIFAMQPLVVMLLVEYFENPENPVPVIQAYFMAGLLTIISFIGGVGHQYFFLKLLSIGFHMKMAMCAMIYNKTLKISQKSLGAATSGHIINLGSTDVLRFDEFPIFLSFLIISPLQLVLAACILWVYVGWAMLGISYLFLIMVIQAMMGKAEMVLRQKTAAATDKRIRIMSEILVGMRIIKMYAWEKPFAKLIEKIRAKEMNKIFKSGIIEAFIVTNFECAQQVLTFLTFIIYLLIGGEIVPSKVFLCISLYGVIRFTCGALFPRAIKNTAEVHISIKRIQAFLLLEDRKSITSNPITSSTVSNAKLHVSLSNVTADWNNELSEANTLSDVNIDVEEGSLVALIGPVGSGKSSVLHCLLGELPVLKGSMNIPSKISYAAQLAWINAGTVRDNILLNESFDENWYHKVIAGCGLKKDIDSFVNGDLTLIGERGITLSGGQKARVSLARAVYRRDIADVFLLDDPLSAVDANVGRHLFDECICGLLKNKTRILVTHQLQFLEAADKIIVLKEGKVEGCGTFDELVKHGTDFATLLKRNEAEQDGGISPNIIPDEHAPFLTPQVSISSQTNRLRTISTTSQYSNILKSSTSLFMPMQRETGEKEVFNTDPLIEKDLEDKELGKEEDREVGKINKSVYFNYFRNGANCFFLIVMAIVMVSNHVLQVLCDWWIAVWAKDYVMYKNMLNNTQTSNISFNNSTVPTETVEEFDSWYYVSWYTILMATSVFTMLIRACMHYYMCVQSSINLHNKMFSAIIRTAIRFFDVNPTGRILNRFSKDMGQIDEQLPHILMDVLYLSGVVITILFVAGVVNYFIIILIIPICIYFIWLRQYFMHTSRDLKRLEGTTRSPVFSLLSATIEGLTTIRAFKLKKTFEETFHEYQDVYGACNLLCISTPRWIALRLDLMAMIFIAASSFSSIAMATYLEIDASQAGLLLVYCLGLVGLLQWTIRQSARAENLMTSVERVLHYSSLEPEDETKENAITPPSDWPQYGIISFVNASYAHYEGGPKVLNKLRFNIRAKEKVGIVGRTGAGKSSLISSLFRMNELTGGEIIVDGLTAKSLQLSDLRSSLSIIPQDPMLFTGTIRLNLDPFSAYTDQQLWNALEQVQLKELVKAMPDKLHAEMQEGGGNFSVGQRQLVCLARALLKKNKILVIDEATANVDLRTDLLIQQTIRENFSHCTVLTIAHRLNTIIDSDRVLVLDKGKVQEFDPPYVLLKKEKGMFYDMVKSTGEEEFAYLRQQAKKVYDLYMKTQYEELK